MEDDPREQGLRDVQDGRVYPVGRALRDTFGADNHASLGSDVTGLMIDLSKVPFEAEAAPPRAPEPLPSASAVRPSILSRIGGLLGRR